VNAITTHVLDLALGRPAAGVAVRLERQAGDGDWRLLGLDRTDADGRVREWPGASEPSPGVHRLTFATGPYLEAMGAPAFFPEVSVVFRIVDVGRHHHVPLLLSPFGYSTYRGS
jgi:5-hydroxyisourate hydrolase